MITKEEVKHIAELARLGITKEEEGKFQKELSSILDYFNFLKKADTSIVEPTFHPAKYFLRKEFERTRKDEVKSQQIEKVNKLRDAFPEEEKGYLKVKSIL